MTKLHFVTLVTGTMAEYDRNSIDDEVIRYMLDVIHGEAQLTQGWSIVVQSHTSDEAQFEILLAKEPLTHCWLCLNPNSSERIWHDAINWGMPLHYNLKRPTTIPWLAVTVTPSIAGVILTQPERLLELPMLEVAVAWALAQPRH